MRRGSERKVPHIGTETRAKLLREAAVRNIGQCPHIGTETRAKLLREAAVRNIGQWAEA